MVAAVGMNDVDIPAVVADRQILFVVDVPAPEFAAAAAVVVAAAAAAAVGDVVVVVVA